MARCLCGYSEKKQTTYRVCPVKTSKGLQHKGRTDEKGKSYFKVNSRKFYSRKKPSGLHRKELHNLNKAAIPGSAAASFKPQTTVGSKHGEQSTAHVPERTQDGTIQTQAKVMSPTGQEHCW